MEGDQRLVQDMLVEWEMENCSSVSTPCSREESGKTGEEGVITDQARVTRFRRAAARINYIALDDPRIAHASKMISQRMARPTEEGEARIKRVLRYLSGYPVCQWNFEWQGEQAFLLGYSDSDWAGCPRSRRSTNGGGLT